MEMDSLTTQPALSVAMLGTCQTAESVVELANRYVAGKPAFEWAMLPSDCRPPASFQVEDISSYALVLIHREFRFAGAAAAFHYELMDFFAGASRRLAELAAPSAQHHPFFSKDAYLMAAGATHEAQRPEPMDSDLEFVWVYRYRYWDEPSQSQKESARFAKLEVIKCGLGEVILSSGKKVRASALVDGAFAD
jgi:hypothetical protein